MRLPRSQQFVYGQIVAMLVIVVSLSLLRLLSLELFFITSFISLLLLVELTSPFNVAPWWRRRLKWFVILGVLGSIYVIGKRILEILPPEFL
ncbi:hypothetical protein M0R89_19120 (plasmid) [Halorussus limi]|uniref:Uncharacterized protein n=1 Tax=Halorussus limi TaxID=2938695 RepID=A0A8U0HZV9_9EURY|nr:hypothetical protein [Halorussus limi]UPV76645.1 hypothetical protein M0R89_19120 [Halorussus limi]